MVSWRKCPVAPAPPTAVAPPAHQRAVAAAWRRQRWPPAGGGWPCAAWVMGRQRRWGCGGGTDANAMSLLLKRLIQKHSATLEAQQRDGG